MPKSTKKPKSRTKKPSTTTLATTSDSTFLAAYFEILSSHQNSSSLPELTVFHKGGYRVCGDMAINIAQTYLKTVSSVTYLTSTPSSSSARKKRPRSTSSDNTDSLPCIHLSQSVLSGILRDLLLVKKSHIIRVFVYDSSSSSFSLTSTASPGNLGNEEFQDLLFFDVKDASLRSKYLSGFSPVILAFHIEPCSISSASTLASSFSSKYPSNIPTVVVGVVYMDTSRYSLSYTSFVDTFRFPNLESIIVQSGASEVIFPAHLLSMDLSKDFNNDRTLPSLTTSQQDFFEKFIVSPIPKTSDNLNIDNIGSFIENDGAIVTQVPNQPLTPDSLLSCNNSKREKSNNNTTVPLERIQIEHPSPLQVALTKTKVISNPLPEEWKKTTSTTLSKLLTQFSTNLNKNDSEIKTFFQKHTSTSRAFYGLLNHLKLFDSNTKISLAHYSMTSHVILDPAVFQALHLFESPNPTKSKKSRNKIHQRSDATLFSILNKCRTSFGSSLLGDWIKQPLCDIQEISNRQSIVSELVNNPILLSSICCLLTPLPNLDVIYSKLSKNRASLTDSVKLFQAILSSFLIIKTIYKHTLDTGSSSESSPSMFTNYSESDEESDQESDTNTKNSQQPLLKYICIPLALNYHHLKKFQEMIESTVDLDSLEHFIDSVQNSRKGSSCRINPQLDPNLASLVKEKTKTFKKMKREQKDAEENLGTTVHLERLVTGQYAFRLSPAEERKLRHSTELKEYSHLGSAKDGYKFTNSTLQELSQQFNATIQQYKALESKIIDSVLKITKTYTQHVLSLCAILSKLDVLCAFALVAKNAKLPWVCPTMVPKGSPKGLVLTQCRHPIVEYILELNQIHDQSLLTLKTESSGSSRPLDSPTQFIPNSCSLQGDSKFHLITGPNMGGKSTYLRSIAISVLLAHMGSFVPCESAVIPIVDSILVRIGADFNLIKGVSTFMAEMIETSTILATSTSNSLIIIDELGRGTSTFDGYGLSAAITEFLALHIQPFTLFATHFHELTKLTSHPAYAGRIQNFHFDALQDIENSKLTFLYKIVPGPSKKSFGISVAKMCGFDPKLMKSAEETANEMRMIKNSSGTSFLKPICDPEGTYSVEEMKEANEYLKSINWEGDLTNSGNSGNSAQPLVLDVKNIVNQMINSTNPIITELGKKFQHSGKSENK